VKVQLPVISNASPSDTTQPLREGLALPELHEAELDWEALDCVLADLDDFVEVVELRGRDAAGAPSAPANLPAARDELVAGQLSSLQVSYRFLDRDWIDTLLRSPTGARLVRMSRS
jgi:hypothetical protein